LQTRKCSFAAQSAALLQSRHGCGLLPRSRPNGRKAKAIYDKIGRFITADGG
jgi:hypothetical protein